MDKKRINVGYWIAFVVLVIAFAAASGWFAWTVPATPASQHIVPMAAPDQTTNREMLGQPGGLDVATQDAAYFPGTVGYYAHPSAPGQYPGVVMMHEWWGLNDNIKGMARTLAAQGYQVLAVDLFGTVATTADAATKQVAALDQGKALDNMKAAVKFLRSHGASRIASLGWCFGGGQSLRLGLAEPLDAVVLYYGAPLITDAAELASLRGRPVLGIFGDKDQAVHIADVRKFQAELDLLGVKNQIVIYPGLGHAFANPSGPTYAPSETLDAWKKTVAFLNANLKP